MRQFMHFTIFSGKLIAIHLIKFYVWRTLKCKIIMKPMTLGIKDRAIKNGKNFIVYFHTQKNIAPKKGLQHNQKK